MSAADVTPEMIAEFEERMCDIIDFQLCRDILDALESSCTEVQRLRSELSRLRSAPVAVEVPEPTHEQWLALAEEAHAGAFLDFMSGASAYGLWLRRNMPHAIPSDRVLKEGERAVPVEEWESLQKFKRDREEEDNRHCSDCAHYRASQSCPGCTHSENPQNDYAFDWLLAQRCEFYALRSGEAEGRQNG